MIMKWHRYTIGGLVMVAALQLYSIEALIPPTTITKTTISSPTSQSSRTITSTTTQEHDNQKTTTHSSSSSRREFFTILTTATTLTTLNTPALAEQQQQQQPLPTTTTSSTTDLSSILSKSSRRALSGGLTGATAALLQVLTLMWLRTAMNYQYRNGGTLSSALSTLYSSGGIPRLYQGLPFAVIQGPLTRFGDTAANMGILAALEGVDGVPLAVKTLAGSVGAGVWRILLMPVDTSKTVLQVEGREGFEALKKVVGEEGVGRLYKGSLASAAATAVGHFPWFLTYNYLNEVLPVIEKQEDLFLFLVRSAVLGCVASGVSDTVSNGLRVIKTTKQTMDEDVGYVELTKRILEEDGVQGLLGRGLQTRLLTNIIQGGVFSVLWKYLQTV